MNKRLLFLIVFILTGCRSKSEAVDASLVTERHSEGVGVLRSIAATAVERETETMVVVMRPDTAGVLQVVSMDVTRRVEKSTETTEKGDTTRFSASDTRTDIVHEEEAVQATETTQTRKGVTAFVVGVWVGFAAIVAVLAAILLKSWTSSH